MANPTPANIINPKFFDRAAAEISGALEANLDWLTTAYKKIEVKVGEKGRYPAIYTGRKNNKGYLDLLPDSKLGNYSYLEVNESQRLTDYTANSVHKFTAGLTFFFDFRTIYPDNHVNQTIENVKFDIYQVLKRYSFTTCKIKLIEIVEGANRVYSGYAHREIDSQFNMRPYGCLKFVFELVLSNYCIDDLAPIVTLPKDSFSITDLKEFDGELEALKFFRVTADGESLELVDSVGGVTTHSALTLDDGNNPHNTDTQDIPASGLSDDFVAAYILAKNT